MMLGMVVKMNALLLVVGGLLLGVGLLLGLAPMSQSGASCGSAFSPSNGGLVADFSNALGGRGLSNVAGQCKDALSSRRGVALALVIPGALVALGGVGVTASNFEKAEKAKRDLGSEAPTIL